MKVLNLGSLNIDKTYEVEKIARPKETIKAIDYIESCGGKGLNQSIAMAKAGIPVFHAGMVGTDGMILIGALKKAGVIVDYIKEMVSPSGHAIIQVDNEGQNCIIICGGANDMVDTDYIDAVFEKFSAGDFLILQNEISNIEYAIERAAEKNMKIVFNPSPFNSKIKGYDLGKINYFMINEIEAELLADLDSSKINEIIDILKAKYSESAFVLTMGDEGAYYFDREKLIYQEAYKVNTIDTTGAGDTFCGFFVSGLLKGYDINLNLKMSSAAAAISVSRKGASNSIPVFGEVEEFLKKNDPYYQGQLI